MNKRELMEFIAKAYPDEEGLRRYFDPETGEAIWHLNPNSKCLEIPDGGDTVAFSIVVNIAGDYTEEPDEITQLVDAISTLQFMINDIIGVKTEMLERIYDLGGNR